MEEINLDPNILLSNKSLKSFMEIVKLTPSQREFLVSKLDEMDIEERWRLFIALLKIYSIDREEEIVIKDIKEFLEDLS